MLILQALHESGWKPFKINISSSNILLNKHLQHSRHCFSLPFKSLHKQRTTNKVTKDKLTGEREIQFTIKHIEVCNNSTELVLKVKRCDSKLVPHPFSTWHYFYCKTSVVHLKSVAWTCPLSVISVQTRISQNFTTAFSVFFKEVKVRNHISYIYISSRKNFGLWL